MVRNMLRMHRHPHQINAGREQPRRAPAGFTLIELLVVIAIIAILALLLIPATGNVMERYREVACQSNLRQLAIAAFGFLNDQGLFPNSFEWVAGDSNFADPATVTSGTLWPYLKDFKVYKCPTFYLQVKDQSYPYGPNTARSYSLNNMVSGYGPATTGRQTSWSMVPRASSRVLFSEENNTWPTFVGGVAMSDRAYNNGDLLVPVNGICDCPANFHRFSSCMASYFDGHGGRIVMDANKVFANQFVW